MQDAADLYIAFIQMLWLMGGLFLGAIGVMFLAGFIYARRYYPLYDGTIVALRTRTEKITRNNSPVFYPVVSYVDANGDVVEAETNGGSSRLCDKIPGMQVRVRVRPDHRNIAQIDGAGLVITAFFLLVAGAVPVAIAFTQYPVTKASFLIFAAFIGWFLYKMLRQFKIKEARPNLSSMRERNAKKLLNERAALRRIEKNEAMDMMRQMDQRTLRAAPMAMLIIIVVLAVGSYVAYDHKQFLNRGVSVEGRVVSVDRKNTDQIYYPVIEYKTLTGDVVRSRGRSGSTHSPHRPGDVVQVRYLPERPMEIVEGGNYTALILGAGLWLIGGGAFVMLVHSVLGARARLRP